jgi:glycosyltransferase involved in cell wall biosynthesis
MTAPDSPGAPAPDAPPGLSVVVPCKNAADTLAEQLEALAAQRYDGTWEVIVADNGSTDGSREIAASFGGRLPGLRVIDASERPGPAHARNRGAAEARGEALAFCDADDVVAPGWLAALGGALAGHRLVASRYDTEALNPGWVAAVRANPQRDGLNPYTYPPFLPHAGGGGLGVSRRLFEELGGFDESMPVLEDTDLCWRAQLAGVELVAVPEALVRVRFRGDLGSIFRQNRVYGEHNVRIYRAYRSRGMPRLGPLPGLARWAKLVVSLPQLATREGRGRWVGQAGWRLGRLIGCLKYRVAAL